MASFQCPDCQGVVSDQAAACPHCGRPMKPNAPLVTQQVVTRGREGPFLQTMNAGCVGCLVLIAVIAIASQCRP